MTDEADQDRTGLSATTLESYLGNASLGEEGFKGCDTPVNLRVISYRKFRHDTDGVSIKAVLDGLVKTGVIATDEAKQIKKVTFESRKVKGKEETERTVIEITEAQE